MKNALIILGFILLLTGCGRRDAKLTGQVTGIWTNDRVVWTLSPDGGYLSQGVGTNDWARFVGTWSVRGGFLVIDFTPKRGGGNVHFLQKEKIVSLDSSNLVIEYGGTDTFRRK
jgi:hypothetical protein